LDRECFNQIVRDATFKKRQKYEEFLGKVPLLKDLDFYERMQVADILKPISYKSGEYIIKKGEIGDKFYFIEEGKVKATKKINESDAQETTVLEIAQGGYFGELALLTNDPRAANVIATADVNLVYLEKDGFKRVLGNLKDIMKRNTQQYVGYEYKEKN